MINKSLNQEKVSFDDDYKKLVSQKKDESILNFFKERPFLERTAKIAGFLAVIAVICNILSAFTESFWLLKKFDLFIPNLGVSLLLVTIIVVAIEGIKRAVLPVLFKEYFNGKIDVTNITLYLIASAISIFLSFESSKSLPSQFTAPDAISTDSIRNHFDALIASKAAEAADYKKSNSWNGTVVRKAVPTYNKFLSEKSELETDRKQAIQEAKLSNKDNLSKWQKNTTENGLQLGYITVLSEMLLFMIIGFLTYRKYRHYLRLVKNNENTPSNNASNNETRNINYNPYTINPGQSTGQQRTVITGFSNFSNRKGNETHNNETRKKKDIKSSKTAISNRKCLHCKKSYVHNHNVQKYCNEKCRQAAHKERTGKKKAKS